jgi:hypothetical protein
LDIWKALPGGIDCGGYQDTFHCFQLLVGRWVKVGYWPVIKVISDGIATDYMFNVNYDGCIPWVWEWHVW